MRAKTLAASAALTAALALVAFPGLAGSRTPSPNGAVEATAFKPVSIATLGQSSVTIGSLDGAYRSANALESDSPIIDPGQAAASAPPTRPAVDQPRSSASVVVKPGRYKLRGYASWYDNGTTAMRLPRGTIVRICGPGGCVERVVTDYGPGLPARVVDLMPSDFVRVCGCGLWRGLTWVTVDVY